LLTELVRLLVLLGHLDGERGSHVLSLNLQLPLLLELTQETVDLLIGVGMLLAGRITLSVESHHGLEQLVPLLLSLLGLRASKHALSAKATNFSSGLLACRLVSPSLIRRLAASSVTGVSSTTF
jgi:hypothetical protein